MSKPKTTKERKPIGPFSQFKPTWIYFLQVYQRFVLQLCVISIPVTPTAVSHITTVTGTQNHTSFLGIYVS